MKRRIDIIKKAYDACIPRIIEEDEIKDDDIGLAIKNYEMQLNNYADTDSLPVDLAVKYVKKLSEHIDLLVSHVENDPCPKTKSPEFYRLAESFFQQYQPNYESKYSSETRSSPSDFAQPVEHKHAPHSQERTSPRPKAEDKYEQKSESRPKPVIKPVVVNEDLRASGNQFRQQIPTLTGDGVAKLLSKHGFLADSKVPAKAMAYQLLTEGYKKAPTLLNQPKAPKGDFALAKQLQDEEIGRFFRL